MRMNRFVLHESGQERSGLDSTENSYDDLLDHLRIMVRKRRITDFASQESVNRLRANSLAQNNDDTKTPCASIDL